VLESVSYFLVICESDTFDILALRARTIHTQEDADEDQSNLDAPSPWVSAAPPQAVVYAASYLLMVPVFERVE